MTAATTQIDLGDLGGDTPRARLKVASPATARTTTSEIVPGAVVVGSGVAQTHDEQRLVQSASSASAAVATAGFGGSSLRGRQPWGPSTMTRG